MVSLTRKVRSAGRSSGSIEITLPPEVQELEGIECRLVLRDGARPEIVIQPDVSVAAEVFAEQWRKLQGAFSRIGDIGPFRLEDFDVSFLPPRHWSERPPLSYRDALALHRARHAAADLDPSGYKHVVTFLSVGAAYRLGLRDRYALVFGVIAGHVVAGVEAGGGADFEEELARQLFNERTAAAAPGVAPKAAEGPTIGLLFNIDCSQDVQDGFARIFALVKGWQEQPELYEESRRRWWGQPVTENGLL
jgi:hypothetical protein